MGFQLVGEVIIDGRKGTVVLKELQREASRTSGVFRQAGHSTERLGKSLLQLGLNAGSAHSSLHSLHRLGAAGLFAGAFAAGINKFGEAVKKSSEDYYQSRKSLNEAFEQSFKSTSVEDAQAGIKKTEDTIESLRGKMAQMGAFKGILSGMEKITGFSFGVADTEKSLKDAQDNLAVQEEILQARKNEDKIIKTSSQTIKSANTEKELRKIARAYDEINGGGDSAVENAKEEVNYSKLQVMNYQWQVEEIFKLNGALQDAKKIDELRAKIGEGNLQARRAELTLAQAVKKEEANRFKQAQEAGGGILGSTRAGQQALENARKVRKRQVGRKNYLTAEGLAPKQKNREALAARQAAGEMPSLAEQLIGAQTNTSPAQIAAETATGKSGKNLQDQLLKAIENLSKKLPAAIAQ